MSKSGRMGHYSKYSKTIKSLISAAFRLRVIYCLGVHPSLGGGGRFSGESVFSVTTLF